MPESFQQALDQLVRSHLAKGLDPRDAVTELTRQANLVIDRNNLELEALRPAAKGGR